MVLSRYRDQNESVQMKPTLILMIAQVFQTLSKKKQRKEISKRYTRLKISCWFKTTFFFLPT